MEATVGRADRHGQPVADDDRADRGHSEQIDVAIAIRGCPGGHVPDGCEWIKRGHSATPSTTARLHRLEGEVGSHVSHTAEETSSHSAASAAAVDMS